MTRTRGRRLLRGWMLPASAVLVLAVDIGVLAQHRSAAAHQHVAGPLVCPADLQHLGWDGPAHAGAHRAAVPGAPVEAVTCTYTLTSRLAGTRLVRGPAMLRLATAADTGARQPTSAGTHTCGQDDGRAFVMRFRYALGPDVTVYVAPSGCSGLDNGAAGWDLGPHVLGVLAGLLPVHGR